LFVALDKNCYTIINASGSSRADSSRFANAIGHVLKIAACISNYCRFKPHRNQCARFIENSNILQFQILF